MAKVFDKDAKSKVQLEEMTHPEAIPRRPFGSTLQNKLLPETVSIVSLGCSSFSTFFMNPSDVSGGAWTLDQLDPGHPRVISWIETIEYAICDAEITVLDTAPWYGHGISEVVLGWALEKILNKPNGAVKREQLTINTKVGRYEADPSRQFDFSASTTVHSVERSILRLRCGTYIDVLQLHDPEFAPSIDLLFEETIPAMLECQAKGWCRALGMTGE
jgi:aryl-alcohol dehydrogenase-like predicted oxidoreductase